MMMSTMVTGADPTMRLLSLRATDEAGGSPGTAVQAARSPQEARDREGMILRYTSLVKYVVAHLGIVPSAVLDYEDLLGYGMLGLVDAVDRFDAKREVKFETYAVARIRGYIVDQLRELDPLSRSSRRRAREVERTALRLEQEAGRPASAEDVAACLGLDTDSVQQALVDARLTIISLDMHAGPAEESAAPCLLDQLVDEQSPSPAAAAERRDLGAALGHLPQREQEIVRLHYEGELTLREISRVLGVSESRVCQLHARALTLLRTYLRGTGAVCAA